MPAPVLEDDEEPSNDPAPEDEVIKNDFCLELTLSADMFNDTVNNYDIDTQYRSQSLDFANMTAKQIAELADREAQRDREVLAHSHRKYVHP